MRRRPASALAALALAAAMTGCTKSPPPAPSSTADAGAGSAAATAPLRGVQLVKAPAGDDVPGLVRDAREKERARGRVLLVYVGATWCEPCQHFHEAAKAGELDAVFPNLTLLEFDLDADRDRLVKSGYRSELIPLFVRPNEDGTGSDRKVQGSVKGNGAVANIAPRLRPLLTP